MIDCDKIKKNFIETLEVYILLNPSFFNNYKEFFKKRLTNLHK